MTKDPLIRLESVRHVRAYSEMWHTSRCLLDAGISNDSGCVHQFRASLVFTAFSLEACLNHIGPEVFDCWSDLEWLRPRAKLNVICEHLGIQVDYSRRPWQIMKPLFGFRNDIAHARSEVIECDRIVAASDAERVTFEATDWEAFATRENAIRAREDVQAIVERLFESEELHGQVPFSFGFQLQSRSPADEGPS